MDQIKNYLYLFILFFCITSCNNKAVNFNNNLMNIQKSVLKEVQELGNKMRKINADSLPLTDIRSQSERISSFINKKIKEAEKLNAPGKGGKLKTAILNQLAFEKDLVEKIGKLAQPDISNEEKAKIETEFLSSGEKAKELEINIRADQEAFAKQYKFKLENK